MVAREPDAGAGAGSCSRYDGRARNYSGGDSSAALTMGLRPKDNVMGDGNDMSRPSLSGMIITGRRAPKAKNVEKLRRVFCLLTLPWCLLAFCFCISFFVLFHKCFFVRFLCRVWTSCGVMFVFHLYFRNFCVCFFVCRVLGV